MTPTKHKNKYIFLSLIIIVFGLPFLVSASTTNGTIDAIYKYAWSNDIGWINFAPTGDSSAYKGLVVTDSTITGYAWSQEYGWINFGPFVNNTEGGVKNTSAGVLSGSAWGQQLGWINFSGVSINSSGQFTGQATGNLVGIINFDLTKCTNCGVKTDWRPTSVRSTTTGGGNSGIVGSNGGSNVPPIQAVPPLVSVIPNTPVPATIPKQPSKQTDSNAGSITPPIQQGSTPGSTSTLGPAISISPSMPEKGAPLIQKSSSSFFGQIFSLILKIFNWFMEIIRSFVVFFLQFFSRAKIS